MFFHCLPSANIDKWEPEGIITTSFRTPAIISTSSVSATLDIPFGASYTGVSS
jgi:hypothetical protein